MTKQDYFMHQSLSDNLQLNQDFSIILKDKGGYNERKIVNWR